MGKKAAKSARKFAAKGHLKKTIEQRHKYQQIQKKFKGRRGAGGSKSSSKVIQDDTMEDNETVSQPPKKTKTVDDILGAGFMEDDEEDSDGSEAENDISDQEDEDDDAASFGSVDDLDEDEGEAHLHELSTLAEKDPEFYKYLQDNDRELLDFDPSSTALDADDIDMNDGTKVAPILTMEILQQWQKALLEARSLRALRKLLIAFRSAAHINEEDQVLAWRIDSTKVYDKLLTTSFRYTPVVLAHHLPYKTLANGKIKLPPQTPKFKTIQKLVLSYFNNVIHLMGQMTDPDMLKTGLNETSKILAYVMTSRKTVKAYMKKCLELWSSAEEDIVRMAAFLSIRKLASSTDSATFDSSMKQCYLTLVRHFKSTNAYTLPSINFMKNSASEIYTLDHAAAYQHAFGYIRQLAIHLRNSMKVKTKESYKQVYNWQFVHSVDFWSMVLARACDQANEGKETELKALIYPLIQVGLGAIRLVNNPKSYPFHLHIIRSLLHLTKHSSTYVPLAPLLLPILTSLISSKSTPSKKSTLKPLDLELQIRAPQQYIKTRVYNEGVIEETVYLLAEWLASKAVHSTPAFPEICVPIITTLKKVVKKGTGGKEVGHVKILTERIVESVGWVEGERRDVTFTPGDIAGVERWVGDMKGRVEKDAPLGKYVKVLRKARERGREIFEKARKEQDDIIDDDDDEEEEEEEE